MKILFISHLCSRTGAPKMLFYIMQWMKENHPEIEIHCLIKEGGVLEKDFIELSDKSFTLYRKQTLVNRTTQFLLNKIYENGSDKLQLKKLRKIAEENYDLVFANTVMSLEAGALIKEYSQIDTKLIAHIHELAVMIKVFLPSLSDYNSVVDHYVAASEMVKVNLIDNHRVSSDKVSVIYEASKIEQKAITKKEKNTFIVGGAGYITGRKGDDFFIQTARILRKNYPDKKIKFCWVGHYSDAQKVMLDADLKKSGLSDMVEFVGETPQPDKYFNEFDVFLLTSREDPFPLVCIEVGMLSVPIICFENATGTSEILEKGGGKIVPYMDVEEMAEQVAFYYDNPKLKIEDGKNAKLLFSTFNTNQIIPQFIKLIVEITKKD